MAFAKSAGSPNLLWGWAAYFCHGNPTKQLSAIDSHVHL